MQMILGGVIRNKVNKTKKQNIADLPSFIDWQNKYYTKHPEEIPHLEKELLNDLRRHPDMPVEVFLAVLRRIAELYGMSKLAKKTNINRVHLYQALSPKGNPTMRTVSKLLDAVGYKLTITPVSQINM